MKVYLLRPIYTSSESIYEKRNEIRQIRPAKVNLLSYVLSYIIGLFTVAKIWDHLGMILPKMDG